MELQYKTRGMSAPQGKAKAGAYLCCHPEDWESCFTPTVEEILESWDCTLWYGDPTVHLDGEYRAQLKEMRLIVLPVTEKLLTTPNVALDEVVLFALERHIPVLPILRETELEWYLFERLDGIRYLDVNRQSETGELLYREELERVLSALLAGGEWAEELLREAAEAGDPAAWDRLAVMYDMGIGVERDPKMALEAREKALKLYRAACKAAPKDSECNRRLQKALEAVKELLDEMDYPYEQEKLYRKTFRELERVCRRGAEVFGDLEAKRGLRFWLSALGREYETSGRWEQSEKYHRMALKLSEELAEETGERTDRLWVSLCWRKLGDMLFRRWRGSGLEAKLNDLVGGDGDRGEISSGKGIEEKKRALELDLRLAEETGDLAVLESLAEDYECLGCGGQQGVGKDVLALYRRKRVETLTRLAERTGMAPDRKRVCRARVELAVVIREEDARRQLELAMEECESVAKETDRTLDWLSLADLYQIRMGFFYEEDKVQREWYSKAEQIFERLARRGLPNMAYRAWLSACAQIVENLEEEDRELLEKADRLRGLCESTSLWNRE